MRVPLQWAGGVNLNADPKAIRDNQLANAKNVMPSLEGLLDKREPVLAAREAFRGDTALDPAVWCKPVTLAIPDPVTGYDFLLHYQDDVNGSEYLLASTLNRETDPPTNPYVAVRANAAGNAPFGPYRFVNYRGRVLAIGGDNEGFYQLERSSGAWVWVKASFDWLATVIGVASAQVQGTSVKPKCACSYRGRMVYANFGAGMGNWLVFADRDSTTHTNVTTAPLWARIGPDVLAENGRHLELRGIQGEDILAIEEVSLVDQGSQMDTALLVLTAKSAVICTGQPAQTTDSEFATADGYLGTFNAVKVNYEVGIAGQSCITTTPYGTVWASKDEVWLLRGNLPTPVGTNIRPALRACPPSMRKWWSVAYAEGVVYLSIVTGDSANEYQLATDHWRLDLRQGVPESAIEARWWGPQDYRSLYTWADPDGNGVLCHSLVTKREADERDVVYSAIRSTRPNITEAGIASIFLITFNLGESALDLPFETAQTARDWTASEFVPSNDPIQPTPLKRNGRLYRYITGGVTGATEPTWNVATTLDNDGTATYREIMNGISPLRMMTYSAGILSATILTDIWFKDFDFGEPARDKVVRRADLEAYLALKTSMGLNMVINGGDKALRMGPVVIGDFTLGTARAKNDLGLMVLGDSAVAMEYQARTLRPSAVQGRADQTPQEYLGAAIVRGRRIQPKLYDSDGWVIDDSNDRLYVVGYIANDIAITAVAEAVIEQGYYDSIDALMDAVKAGLNAITTLILRTAGDWDYESTEAGVTPYMVTITKGMTTPRNTERLAFLFYTEDLSDGDVPYYLTRSKRLLTSLGFDTSEAYANADGATLGVGSLGTAVKFYGECQDPLDTVSPTKVYASEVVPVKRASGLSLASLTLDIHLKAALPFSRRSR